MAPGAENDHPEDRERRATRDAELSGTRGAPRKAFLLRIPPTLHDELRRWASREMRSLNAQVEYLLREAVRKKRGQGDRGGEAGED